jgi:hypothetical protein
LREPGGFLKFIEAQAGGLKALVAAERQARRPERIPDTKTQKARERLRSALSVELGDIASHEEFALVLTRRSIGGTHEAVAVIDDPALVERAIRRAGALTLFQKAPLLFKKALARPCRHCRGKAIGRAYYDPCRSHA